MTTWTLSAIDAAIDEARQNRDVDALAMLLQHKAGLRAAGDEIKKQEAIERQREQAQREQAQREAHVTTLRSIAERKTALLASYRQEIETLFAALVRVRQAVKDMDAQIAELHHERDTLLSALGGRDVSTRRTVLLNSGFAYAHATEVHNLALLASLRSSGVDTDALTATPTPDAAIDTPVVFRLGSDDVKNGMFLNYIRHGLTHRR